MAFESHLEEDRASFTVQSDGKYVKKYFRRYLCKNDIEMTLDEVCDAMGILPGAPHIDWAQATCGSITPSRKMTREPHCAWYVDYEWSTGATVPETPGDTDPVLRRVTRSTDQQQQQRFIIKDRNGVLLTDKAGSPFDGGVPVTDHMGSITFERDEPHDASKISQGALLSGKMNSVTFLGCAPGTLMLVVTGTEKWEGAYHFWTFRYVMQYDKNGWQPKPANAGLYQKVSGRRVRILEDDGKPTTEPQPLTDITGRVIPVANRPLLCNFITVDHFESFDFATLLLPTT